MCHLEVFAPDGFKLGRNMMCNTLAEAIINQLINNIINDNEYIRCLECQKWMTQGRKKVEKKNYCSSQCRSKAYDRRKKLEDSEELKTFIKSFKVSEKTIEPAKKEMQKNSNLRNRNNL